MGLSTKNFGVGKSEVQFTSLGSDKAMEQENNNLKVNGGITGLTQMPSTLSRFCLVIPVISSLSDDYMKKYDTLSNTFGKEKLITSLLDHT